MKRVLALAVAVVMLSFPAAASAVTMFSASLTNSQENPPVTPTLDGSATPRPTSFGTATLTLNDALTELTFSVTVFNIDFGRVPSQGTPVTLPPNPNPDPQTPDILNDDLIVAHFHRGPVGTNGPVIFGFIGSPFNDNDPNDVVVTPFSSGVGGTVTGRWNLAEGNNTTLADELANLFGGLTYINFHTAQFGGGEIRGQVNLVSTVPGPAGLGLLLLGGALVAGMRGRLLRRDRSPLRRVDDEG